MLTVTRSLLASVAVLLALVVLQPSAFAQQTTPLFTPGNLVVVVEGCGVHGGTCTSVPNGTGTGGGYGDNQAAPLTLFLYAPDGTSTVTFVNALVFPQSALNANFPISGEYGSSSEGTLQLSGLGQYLTLMAYGINSATFNAAYSPGFTADPYGAAPSGALAQSGSLTGQTYTPVPRVITLIDPYGNVSSSTALYNIFNTNNPRSIYTADGITTAYVSGQGSGCDSTGGVFYTPLGAPNSAPTAITGLDANASSSCTAQSTIAQDTRTVMIYNGTLYISVDSTEGKSFNRSFIGMLGNPPTTTLYVPLTADPYVTGPTMLTGYGNAGGTGKVSISLGTSSNGNGLNGGLQVNMSPVNYFFASPSVLYVADSGNPKQSSATSSLGNGGLQKWVNSKSNGTGTWSLTYTLYKGLDLVENPTANSTDTSGTTGLYGLTGMVSNGIVYLYATNYTISDLDPTYLYGITDALTTSTNPGTSFTLLDTAPADSNFKGVSFAPSLPVGSATVTSSPSGLAISTSGSGCMPGTYTTPFTLVWTQGSVCTLSAASPQGPTGTEYSFTQWQDGSTSASHAVSAPTTSAVYTATFATNFELTTSASAGGTVSAGGYIPGGTDAVVTATPNTGYYFVNFTGTTTSTSNPLTLPMNGPQSIVANFAPQVTPTVSWPTAAAITYGQTLASSLLTGGSASVAGMFAFTTPSTAPSAGTQAQNVSFTPNSSEYATVTGTVNVTVNPAPLTVTANNANRAAGAANPGFTFAASGFVNGDSAGSLATQPTCSTTATPASPAGSYPISCMGAVDPNYSIQYLPGTLTVTTAAGFLSLVESVGSTVTIAVDGNHVATLTITNNGNVAATAQITAASVTAVVGGVAKKTATSTALPISAGLIMPGASATVQIEFPSAAGTSGGAAAVQVTGTYTSSASNGNFSTTSKATWQ